MKPAASSLSPMRYGGFASPFFRLWPNSRRIVRLPLNRVGTLNKISKAYSQLEQEFERDPNTRELATLLEMDSQDVADTLKIAGRHVSVDAPFAQGDDNRLLDVLQNDGHLPDYGLNRDSLTLEVERSLSVLAPREADVIKSYFGIGMDNPLTLEEIGEKFKPDPRACPPDQGEGDTPAPPVGIQQNSEGVYRKLRDRYCFFPGFNPNN